jgi:hypothetical protein
MYPKFIITIDGVLKFGNVYLHKELLPKGHTTCYGGGLWKVDHARSCIILYGRSFDFGLPDLDKIERVDCEGPGAWGTRYSLRGISEMRICLNLYGQKYRRNDIAIKFP